MARRKRRLKTPKTSTRQLARPYTSLIYAGKHLGEEREKQLKAESRCVISQVLNHTPFQRIKLLGYTFPTDVNDLAASIPTAPTNDPLIELNWLYVILCHYADKINAFLSFLDQFQASFLRGEYE